MLKLTLCSVGGVGSCGDPGGSEKNEGKYLVKFDLLGEHLIE